MLWVVFAASQHKSSMLWTQNVFPFICVCFNFSKHCFVFLLYKSFTSLVELVPKYFIPFDAVINVTVFLIFFSDYSLLVYKNAADSYVLVLYLATLLNSFISYNSFFVESLWLFTYKVISSVNRDNFISLICLIA